MSVWVQVDEAGAILCLFEQLTRPESNEDARYEQVPSDQVDQIRGHLHFYRFDGKQFVRKPQAEIDEIIRVNQAWKDRQRLKAELLNNLQSLQEWAKNRGYVPKP